VVLSGNKATGRKSGRSKSILFLAFGASLIPLVILVGCAGSRKQWVLENCTKEGAQRLGQRDAKRGNDLDPVFLRKCPSDPPDQHDALRSSYEAGYKSVRPQVTKESTQKSTGQGEDAFEDITNFLNDEQSGAPKKVTPPEAAETANKSDKKSE
jgi:heme exporter protein D